MGTGVVEKYMKLWEQSVVKETQACEHCLRAEGAPGDRICNSPDGVRLPATVSRSFNGPCGPEARLMSFPV